MDAATIRKRMQALGDQYASDAEKAGNMGGDLQEILRNRKDTFATENNDINTKKNKYYNSLGEFDAGDGQRFRDDPELYFNKLAQFRTQLGTDLSNDEDIRRQKAGTINEFMQNFINKGNLQAQRTQQQYGNAQNDFNNAITMEQMQLSRAAAGRAASAQDNEKTTGFLQGAQQQAMMDYQNRYLDPTTKAFKAGYEPGTENYQKIMNYLTMKNIESSRGTLPGTGYDGKRIDSFTNQLKGNYLDPNYVPPIQGGGTGGEAPKESWGSMFNRMGNDYNAGKQGKKVNNSSVSNWIGRLDPNNWRR